MEQVLTFFLELPTLAIYGTFGVVGFIIGTVINLVVKKEKAKGVISTACILSMLMLPKYVLPQMQVYLALAQTIEEVKKEPRFAIIFKHHPEAEAELKDRIHEAVELGSMQQTSQNAALVSEEILGRYFQKYVLLAPDHVIHKMMIRTANILRGLRETPESCVTYHLNPTLFAAQHPDPNFASEEIAITTEVMETGIASPTPLASPMSEDEVVTALEEGYLKNGFELSNFLKIDSVQSLPAEEGCQVLLEFTYAIATLETARASRLYKTFLSEE